MKKNNPVIPREFLVPFVLVTTLFSLWGFANDITNPMVAAFQKVLELSNVQASLVQAAFYGGYFTMALPAAIFIKKYSYKSGILVGLGLYAIGALMFFPAACLEQFWIFLAAYYILTFGLAFLETTANPYILSMGDEATSTRRLNFAQSFNPLGSISGMIIAQQVILQNLKSDDIANYAALSDTQKAGVRTADLEVIMTPYLILGFVVVAMFLVFLFAKLPASKDSKSFNFKATMKRLLGNKKYTEGVIAQTFYMGAQIMCWTYIIQYASNLGIENGTAVYYNMVAMGIFILGRFTFTYLMKFFNAGKILLGLGLAGAALTSIAIFVEGMTGLYALVAVSFCMSVMFPTIYGIALQGQGEDAKFGAAGLIMAIVGGALMPPLQGAIMDIGGSGFNDTTILGVSEVNFSFILPFICLIMVAVYGYRAAKIHLKS